jgi:NAD(P)-dependent dehydrogenase (short-subunit alcohol dehydrogenase family)
MYMDSSPVVLVTGGAAGIGRSIAERFLAGGYSAHICDTDSSAVDEFPARSAGASATVADISSVTDVDRVFGEIREKYGRLDVLINNAGIAGPTASTVDIEPAEWDRTIAVSLSGQFYVTRLAIPLLANSSAASIINISSNAAFFGFPMRLPYTASKWALIGITKTLAMELGPEGIRVNAICPGSVSGPRIDRVIRKDAEQRGMTEEEIRDIYTRQSSMRKFVEAYDVANLAYFLASDAGAMISGQAIGVDGHTESLSNWLD